MGLININLPCQLSSFCCLRKKEAENKHKYFNYVPKINIQVPIKHQLTLPVNMSYISAPRLHQSTALPWPLRVRISGALILKKKPLVRKIRYLPWCSQYMVLLLDKVFILLSLISHVWNCLKINLFHALLASSSIFEKNNHVITILLILSWTMIEYWIFNSQSPLMSWGFQQLVQGKLFFQERCENWGNLRQLWVEIH